MATRISTENKNTIQNIFSFYGKYFSFMNTLALDSQFCKVQNKVSISTCCDSSFYIVLGNPDIIFLTLLRLAGNRVQNP